jgi:hypothetical protein
MWLAAVLASAVVRSTVLLTDAVPAVRGYVGGDGRDDGGGGGAKQVETVPARPVRVVAKVQTVAPETKTLVPQ